MAEERMISWVESANSERTDFPLENLPFGVYSPSVGGTPRIGIAIGDEVLDLRGADEIALLDTLPEEVRAACSDDSLNRLMSLGRSAATVLRRRVTGLLLAEDRSAEHHLRPLLTPMRHVRMHLPAVIRDYTDFYASLHHAENVGKLFRPDNPLLPNYKHLPVGYHGRASSIVVDGAEVRRPWGQRQPVPGTVPVFEPSRSLDYELELGFFIAEGNSLGEPVPVNAADAMIFGLCLLNDWSARDIQAWEYQPLGPFLGKNFATSISPWVVTMDALAPFRTGTSVRGGDDPALLPYLRVDTSTAGLDIVLEVSISTAKMRQQGSAPSLLARTNSLHLYWSLIQMIAHHTSNGCNLRPADLLATGTISGPTSDSLGSMLELTRRGADPIRLASGEMRSFLEDGDEIILRGYCERFGAVRIGFGECRGVILPAHHP